MKKVILYIGNFDVLAGNATGKRAFGNGLIFRELGYEVIFVGLSKSDNISDSIIETKENFKGFDIYNFKYPKSNSEWVFYKKKYNSIIRLASHIEKKQETRIEYIVLGHISTSLFNLKIIKWARNNKKTVLTTYMDWLKMNYNNKLKSIFKSIDKKIDRTYVCKKSDGVITISNYLSDFFKKKDLKTIVIPPVTDNLSQVEFVNSKSNSDVITITYAGIPFNIGQKYTSGSNFKDRIDKTLRYLSTAKEAGCKFELNIYGITKEQYCYAVNNSEDIGVLNKLDNNVKFFGLVASEVVKNAVQNADYTILIRDNNRTTLAGFPSKFPESISLGTPIITNQTSDISDYLVEGKNGYFLDFDDQKAINKLIQILLRGRSNVYEMKEYCIKNNPFYYKEHVNKMGVFLDSFKQ